MAEPVPALSGPVRVELVCLWPGHSWQRSLALPPGSTVADAMAAAGWQQVPERPQIAAVGIHGQVVQMSQVVRPGDRVELYRPLQADPKDSRRARASREGGQRASGRRARPDTA